MAPVGDEATWGVSVASLSPERVQVDPFDQRWCFAGADVDVEDIFGFADGWVVPPLDSPEAVTPVLPACDAAQKLALRHWLQTGRCSSSAVGVAGPGASRSRSRSPIGRHSGWGHSSSDGEAPDGEIAEAESVASCSSPSSSSSSSSASEDGQPESAGATVAAAEADGHAWRMSDSEDGQSESAGATATTGAAAEADGAHAWRTSDSESEQMAVSAGATAGAAAAAAPPSAPSTSSSADSDDSSTGGSSDSDADDVFGDPADPLPVPSNPAAARSPPPPATLDECIESLAADQTEFWDEVFADPPACETSQLTQAAGAAGAPVPLPSGMAPGLLRRLARPEILNHCYWGEPLWHVLEHHSHPYALRQPPRSNRWELQCTGAGGELMGFEVGIYDIFF